MAAGKLTSRFGDGNSSDGGSWDRGPFGAATSGFSPGPRFCCFRRHHTIMQMTYLLEKSAAQVQRMHHKTTQLPDCFMLTRKSSLHAITRWT